MKNKVIMIIAIAVILFSSAAIFANNNTTETKFKYYIKIQNIINNQIITFAIVEYDTEQATLKAITSAKKKWNNISDANIKIVSSVSVNYNPELEY